MHHSTVEPLRLATPVDADGFFFDLGSFYEQAELVADPRDPRGKRYALALLISLQVLVERKENEIPAAPRLLQTLDLRGKIVMGDAMHTQREVSVQILSAGGEYIWYAKDNQPKLHQDIAQLFTAEVTGKGSGPVPT